MLKAFTDKMKALKYEFKKIIFFNFSYFSLQLRSFPRDIATYVKSREKYYFFEYLPTKGF